MTTYRAWLVKGNWKPVVADSLEEAERIARRRFRRNLSSVRPVYKRSAAQ